MIKKRGTNYLGIILVVIVILIVAAIALRVPKLGASTIYNITLPACKRPDGTACQISDVVDTEYCPYNDALEGLDRDCMGRLKNKSIYSKHIIYGDYIVGDVLHRRQEYKTYLGFCEYHPQNKACAFIPLKECVDGRIEEPCLCGDIKDALGNRVGMKTGICDEGNFFSPAGRNIGLLPCFMVQDCNDICDEVKEIHKDNNGNIITDNTLWKPENFVEYQKVGQRTVQVNGETKNICTRTQIPFCKYSYCFSNQNQCKLDETHNICVENIP